MTWGDNAFTGLPEYPRTPYYRAATERFGDETWLFELVVPMVPPSWNDRGLVADHAERLRVSSRPTCLALGVLDIRQRAMWATAEQAWIHWGLAHFLLDGHHKIEATASIGARLQVLSLVSIGDSLAPPADVARLPAILGR